MSHHLIFFTTILLTSRLVSAVPAPQYSYNANNPKTDGNSNIGDQNNGNDGSSSSYAGLSTGALVAIAIVVALVVIGGISTGILFYLAKKRQWQVRKTIRRTASKILRTPRTATFSPRVKHSLEAKTDANTLANSRLGQKQQQQPEKQGLGVKVVDADSTSNESESESARSSPGRGPVKTTRQQQEREKLTVMDHKTSNSSGEQRWSRILGRP